MSDNYLPISSFAPGDIVFDPGIGGSTTSSGLSHSGSWSGADRSIYAGDPPHSLAIGGDGSNTGTITISPGIPFIADSITAASINTSALDIDEIARALMDKLYGATPKKVIIKCRYCGQHGAIYTPCRFCGAPIE